MVSLALAIGANTAVFTLLNAVVLRELPVRDPERLVAIETFRPNENKGPLTFPAFEAIVQQQQAFSEVIGYWGDGIFSVETSGGLVRGDVWAVTGNFYQQFGLQPVAGRLLMNEAVDLEGGSPAMVAVLGYGIWQREFGGDPSVVGRPVRVEDQAFTIVGIALKGFAAFGLISEPDVTIPLTASPLLMANAGLFSRDNRRSRWVSAIGRLKDGVSIEQADAQVQGLWTGIREATLAPDLKGQERDTALATKVAVTSAAHGREYFLRSRFSTSLFVVFGVALLMLLIACVNLASLLVSRAAARSEELSLRIALGASRWRVARQMVTEGLLLSAIAAIGGVVFAAWTDPVTLAGIVLLMVLIGVLAGFVPGRRASRANPIDALRA